MNKVLPVVWLVLVLAACTTQIELDTTEKKIGAVYASVIAGANATSDGLLAGRLTVTQANQVLGLLTQVDGYADLATAAVAAGRADDALFYISLAQALLDQLASTLGEG